MRTKLFPDETAEALDELEYHPHHVHAPGSRSSGSVGTGSTGPASAGLPPPSEAAVGARDRASPSPGTGSGKGAKEGSGTAVSTTEHEKGDGGRPKSKGREGEGTMIQRMNKTFRPDPLGAYTGDRSTLRFKPRRQEGLTTLRPRQQRTIFDASQISPMLQVCVECFRGSVLRFP